MGCGTSLVTSFVFFPAKDEIDLFSPHASCLKKSHHVLSGTVYVDFPGAGNRLFANASNLEIRIKSGGLGPGGK